MIERGFVVASLVVLLVMFFGMAGYFVVQGFSISGADRLPAGQAVSPTPIVRSTPSPTRVSVPTRPVTTVIEQSVPKKVIPQQASNTPVASPLSGIAPLLVNFSIPASASVEYSNSGIYYTIVFGDGEAGAFPRIPPFVTSHTYTSAGTYTATITERTQCSSWECLGPSRVIGTLTVMAK